jgi:CheY-like chemotaxis protein
VEDEPGLVITLGDRLRGEGHQVESAADGQTGLDMACGGAYDLIATTISQPKRQSGGGNRKTEEWPALRAVPPLILPAPEPGRLCHIVASSSGFWLLSFQAGTSN